MRRAVQTSSIRLAIAAALVLAPVLAQAAAGSGGDIVEVTLDKAKIIRMPANALTIVVGNPSIADVTALKADGLVVVTGKGYGETNMIFLDKGGAALEEAEVRVVSGRSQLLVQRGMERESYSCRPRCEPTVSLGDADPFLKAASGQIQSRNALAVPSSH